MPFFSFAINMLTNTTATPLANWNYRFPPKMSLIELLIWASGVGVTMNLTTGPESIVQAESPVSAGGTVGVLPSRFQQEPIVDVVNPGEEIVLFLRNTNAAARDVMGVVNLQYK